MKQSIVYCTVLSCAESRACTAATLRCVHTARVRGTVFRERHRPLIGRGAWTNHTVEAEAAEGSALLTDAEHRRCSQLSLPLSVPYRRKHCNRPQTSSTRDQTRSTRATWTTVWEPLPETMMAWFISSDPLFDKSDKEIGVVYILQTLWCAKDMM